MNRATAVGVYWLFSYADDTGLIAESDETNNCAGSVTRMTVRAELTDSLDFGSTPSYLYPGQTFTQMNYVYNAFGTAGPSRVMFRLSLDTTITGADPYLGSLDTPELGPGAFQWFGANVTVPALPEGEYYIGACADELQVVPESSETNNCSVSPMTFNLRWAALSVTAIPSYPGTVIPGVSFSVTDTTSNAAGLGGDASAFAIEYRLSTDATITTADTLLTGGRLVPYLQAGQSDTGSTSVIVPVGTPSGHYYLGVCADWSNSVPELDEGNNCRATGGTIQVQ